LPKRLIFFQFTLNPLIFNPADYRAILAIHRIARIAKDGIRSFALIVKNEEQ